MRPWTAVKLWAGSTAFIIGGGPSLANQDLSGLRGRRVIGVNDAFKLGPELVDICWFGDCRWHRWNENLLPSFPGLIVSCSPCKCEVPGVLKLKRVDKAGLTANPENVLWNKSSGASAINFALHLGVKRVVLLGFDMKVGEKGHNWHKNHKHTPRPTIYQQLFLPPFQQIAEDAAKLGLEIVNATPGSALEVFPFVSLEEALLM